MRRRTRAATAGAAVLAAAVMSWASPARSEVLDHQRFGDSYSDDFQLCGIPVHLEGEDRGMFNTRVGNPETEEEFLWSRSPLSKVDQIKIPMLIAQGANDPRVKQAESEQIVEAMRENGVEHEYLLYEDEGHGFAKPENRLHFYAAAERFLARHLGGAAEEEPGSPALS